MNHVNHKIWKFRPNPGSAYAIRNPDLAFGTNQIRDQLFDESTYEGDKTFWFTVIDKIMMVI